MKRLLIGAALLSMSATAFAGSCAGVIAEIKEACNVEFENTSIISSQRDRCHKATKIRLIHRKSTNQLLAVNLNSCATKSQSDAAFKVYATADGSDVVNANNQVFLLPGAASREGEVYGITQKDSKIKTFEVKTSSGESYQSAKALGKDGRDLEITYGNNRTFSLNSSTLAERRDDESTLRASHAGDRAMEQMGILGHKKKVEDRPAPAPTPRPSTPDYGDSDY